MADLDGLAEVVEQLDDEQIQALTEMLVAGFLKENNLYLTSGFDLRQAATGLRLNILPEDRKLAQKFERILDERTENESVPF